MPIYKGKAYRLPTEVRFVAQIGLIAVKSMACVVWARLLLVGKQCVAEIATKAVLAVELPFAEVCRRCGILDPIAVLCNDAGRCCDGTKGERCRRLNK